MKKVKSKIEFIPKNKEQEDAISSCVDFIEKGNADEIFVIVGKAGTGKTTIAQAILGKYIRRKKILVCALSHKAKIVISEKLSAAYGKSSIISKSVAGSLGMNMDMETGKFKVDGSNQLPPIKIANIILCDEGSMINEESYKLIMQEKKTDCKVIFLGDVRQLPPIREESDPNKYKPSPVFYSKNIAVLNERIRQDEESPILPFADYFGDNSRKKYPELNPAPIEVRKNIVTNKGALVFVQDLDSIIESIISLYKTAVEKSDLNIIKTVSYKNDKRKYINESIRTELFGEESFDQYLKGDLIIFNDNYFFNEFEEPISNSFEAQVLSADNFNDGYYNVWSLNIIYEAKPVDILTLDESDKTKHAADVKKAFEYAKKIPFGSSQRSEALQRAWELKKRYADIEYAYAITSHKSQGSTYNTVIVDESDIMSVKMITNKEKSQSMYTAITRCSTTCIVIDGQTQDETLLQAIELSKSIIENKMVLV